MKSDNKQEIEVMGREVNTLYSQVIELAVTNNLELTAATGVLGRIKTKQKELKAKKKAIVDPLKVALDEVKKLFREPEDQLVRAEATVKDALLAYHQEQEAIAKKKIDGVERRMDKGTVSIETGIAKLSAIDVPQSNVQTAEGSVQFRDGAQKVRITSVDDLLTARPSLLSRDRVMEALRMEVAADIKAGAPVPNGVEVYREKVVAGVGV